MMRTIHELARRSLDRTIFVVASVAALVSLFLGATVALAADAPTKFSLGPFQNIFETVRPYAMVGFLILGIWALLHNFGRTLTGTIKSGPGGATMEHRGSIGKLLELVLVIVVLEGLVYLTLWYGLDLFSYLINLLQQAATTPPAN